MRVVVEAQSLLKARTGVGEYTYQLLHHLFPLLTGQEIKLFYFNFLGRNKHIPLWDNLSQIREQRLFPGRLFYYLWKKQSFPPFNWLAGKADLYHFPNFIMRPLSTGKAVITIHDLSFVRYPEFCEKKNLRFLSRWIPYSLEKSSKILVVSEFTKRELIEVFKAPQDKIVVAPNGVSSLFRPERRQALLSEVKEKYRLPDKFILAVGTLEPRKNLLVVLHALSILKKDQKEVPPLIVVGPPGWNQEYERLKKFVEKEGLDDKVRFLFYVDRSDMPVLYSLAQLFVFPSLYEGFGLPVLEAMACGTLVLSSDKASLPEVGGEAACYCSPEDPYQWAEGMSSLCAGDEKERVELGLEQVKKFSWDKTAKITLETYEQAIGVKR